MKTTTTNFLQISPACVNEVYVFLFFVRVCVSGTRRTEDAKLTYKNVAEQEKNKHLRFDH